MTQQKPMIAVTNDVAWTLQQLNTLYATGRLKGFTAQMMLTENESGTLHCGDISYIEKLGLIEMAKQDLLVGALNEE